MNLPITQSEQWKKLQDDLNEKSFYLAGKDYVFLAVKKSTPAGNYLYLPYGPVAETKHGFKNAIESLTELAKEHNAIFIRIEPQIPDFVSNLPYLLKKTTDLNPKETWILDLTGNDEELKATVKNLVYFNSFEEVVDNYEMKRIYLDNTSKEEFINLMKRFYTDEIVKEYGVVAIEFELLK